LSNRDYFSFSYFFKKRCFSFSFKTKPKKKATNHQSKTKKTQFIVDTEIIKKNDIKQARKE